MATQKAGARMRPWWTPDVVGSCSNCCKRPIYRFRGFWLYVLFSVSVLLLLPIVVPLTHLQKYLPLRSQLSHHSLTALLISPRVDDYNWICNSVLLIYIYGLFVGSSWYSNCSKCSFYLFIWLWFRHQWHCITLSGSAGILFSSFISTDLVTFSALGVFVYIYWLWHNNNWMDLCHLISGMFRSGDQCGLEWEGMGIENRFCFEPNSNPNLKSQSKQL